MISALRFGLFVALSAVVASLTCRGDDHQPSRAPELQRAVAVPSRVVRILPLGDSITYENHQRDKRPTDARIAYRHRLWELLVSDGRKFDFVGNRNAGLQFFDDLNFADNAGFPGIKTDELAELVLTGDGGPKWLDQAPGLYLDSYPAEVVLLHIGTNGLAPDNWTHVERILDTIDRWASAPGNPKVTTVVARIIDRWPHSAENTAYNDKVEAMVARRHAAGGRVLLVDMEQGAGIDYMLEMDDKLHPRHSGYAKMAEQWFPAVAAVLDARPYVAVRAPVTGEALAEGSRLVIKADVFYPGSKIDQVEFRVGGVCIGTDDTAPYSADWTVPAGRGHSIEAVAVYAGAQRSASRAVVVNPWRILALGDGITQGEFGYGSFRYELWKRCVDARVPFRFVGSSALLRGEVLGYWSDARTNQIRHEYARHAGRWFDSDRYHEGHWGWRADELVNGKATEPETGSLVSWLDKYSADVAFVHAGMADVVQGGDAASTLADLGEIVGRLRAKNPRIAVFLAKLLPMANPEHNRTINEINARLENLVATLSTPESPIKAIERPAGFDPAADTYDGIHPNAAGEEKLAAAVFEPLAEILGIAKRHQSP